jgi:predicted DNA-binding transcriptional regulator AlpA
VKVWGGFLLLHCLRETPGGIMRTQSTPAAGITVSQPAPHYPDRVLTLKQLPLLGIPYCNVHLLRMERAGRFPRRFYLMGGTAVWSESDLIDWLKAEKVKSQSTAPPVFRISRAKKTKQPATATR